MLFSPIYQICNNRCKNDFRTFMHFVIRKSIKSRKAVSKGQSGKIIGRDATQCSMDRVREHSKQKSGLKRPISPMNLDLARYSMDRAADKQILRLKINLYHLRNHCYAAPVEVDSNGQHCQLLPCLLRLRAYGRSFCPWRISKSSLENDGSNFA